MSSLYPLAHFRAPRRRRRGGAVLAMTLVLGLAAAGTADARRERLELAYAAVELPGAPSAIVAGDVDGDGVHDLAVVVAYTFWDRIYDTEQTTMDDVEGLVEVLTVVPALFDRRELWLFLGDGDGGYRVAGPPLELELSVLSLFAGPPAAPVLALTDDGVAVLRLAPAAVDAAGDDARVETAAATAGVDGDGSDGDGSVDVADEPASPLRLEPLIADPPVLAGSGSFVPELPLARDADGDGMVDLLLPARRGLHVYLATADGLATTPASRLRLPALARTDGRLDRHVPLPTAGDVDGDGHPDLLVRSPRHGWGHPRVMRGLGGGRFGPVFAPLPRPEARGEGPEVVHFGDLDGDGVAEWVLRESLADEDAGFRKSMREAKRPPTRYLLHRADRELALVAEPYASFEATGYAFDEAEGDEADEYDSEFRIPGGFQDLDGDGRQDLVTLTLDFSLLQAVRVLTVRSISIGLDFHVWCQDQPGRFRAVTGLDLSGRFKIDLDNFRIGQLSQFAGDFDGDGRADFVQLGRGEKVSIHRGREGCVYPPEPDLIVALEAEPRNLALVRIADLDGDDLADLLVIQPQKVDDVGVTPPVRLDLYLSGGGE